MDHQDEAESGEEGSGGAVVAALAANPEALALGVVVEWLAEELGRHRADRYDLVIPQLSAPRHGPLGFAA
jgi:hypothetical protein